MVSQEKPQSSKPRIVQWLEGSPNRRHIFASCLDLLGLFVFCVSLMLIWSGYQDFSASETTVEVPVLSVFGLAGISLLAVHGAIYFAHRKQHEQEKNCGIAFAILALAGFAAGYYFQQSLRTIAEEQNYILCDLPIGASMRFSNTYGKSVDICRQAGFRHKLLPRTTPQDTINGDTL